jgi:hypothetical protein
MLSGNDSESRKTNDLYCRPLVPIPLPPEVLAQEKDIEAMFQYLTADSRDQNREWILVVLLLCFLSGFALWLLYLRVQSYVYFRSSYCPR